MPTSTSTTTREATLRSTRYTRSPLSVVALQSETSDSDEDDSLDDLPAPPVPHNAASRRARRGASTTSTREVVFNALNSSEPVSLLNINTRRIPPTPTQQTNKALAPIVQDTPPVKEDAPMDTIADATSDHHIVPNLSQFSRAKEPEVIAPQEAPWTLEEVIGTRMAGTDLQIPS